MSAEKFPSLTQSATIVYETLCELGRTCKGEIYPSYAWLIERTALSRATIARALRQLKDAGFLTIQRRSKRIEREGPGPRFEQTSNAYRLDWPTRLSQWLGFPAAPCPLPADIEAERLEEQARAIPAPPKRRATELDSILERMENALIERESQIDTQPLYKDNNISNEDKRLWPSRPKRKS